MSNSMTAAEYRHYVATGELPVQASEIQPANEKVFTDIVLRVFRSHDWIAYHTHDSRRSEPGFPDIVAVHPERGVVFAELKMPSGRPSEAQRRWMDTLQRAGARVYLWRPEHFTDIEAVAKGEA